MPTDDISDLAEAVTAAHPRFGKWEFEYMYPGYFAYHLYHKKISVFFTPDNSEEDVIDIQVNHDDDPIENSEVPFVTRTVENLFNAVKPWLEKYAHGLPRNKKHRGPKAWRPERR